VPEGVAEHDARPDPGRRARQADERGFPGDQAADLTGRRGDGAQQRDLAFALLDGQAHRAGHDEHGDEHRQPAERGRDRDQRAQRPLELRVLAPAPSRPSEHPRALGSGPQTRHVKVRPAEHGDRVDPSRMASQAGGGGVGQEDCRLQRHGVARAGDAHYRHGAGRFGGRQGQPGAQRGGIAGDHLVRPVGRTTGAQHVGREGRARPPMGDGRPVADLDRRRDVADRGPDARHGRQPTGKLRADTGPLGEHD
jgi:hypothetical protein